jgi:hypothetical protein
MIDLTKIKTPFGLLEPETQEALKAHGGPYEVYCHGEWLENNYPTFRLAVVYRVKPQPLTKPSIDWSHVAPKWRWLARDADDDAFLYKEKPYALHSKWSSSKEIRRADTFASYTPGTCDWKDSLVERPE